MIPFFKKFTLAVCVAVTVLTLSGCGSKPEETTPPTPEPIVLPTAPAETEATIAPERLEEHLTAKLDAGELYTLDYYPNLKTVDLSGSTCYSAIVDFASKRPHLDITYTVSLGATDISSKADSAALKAGSFDYDLLMENLKYLPNLTALTLVDVDLTAEQLDALRAEIQDDLENVMDEEQEALDNMPESLQDSEKGQQMQEYIDAMQYALDDLESIDVESMMDQLQEIVG